MHTVYPCLWFDNQAEQAAQFYTSVFKNSRILSTTYYGEGMPLPAGTVLTVNFELDGHRFMALNGGPDFHFSEAVSFVVPCQTQADLDAVWDALLDGGTAQQCGWLKDRFGLSWQIVPAQLDKWIDSSDPARAQRVLQALMQMVKLDLATLERAYHGAAAQPG